VTILGDMLKRHQLEKIKAASDTSLKDVSFNLKELGNTEVDPHYHRHCRAGQVLASERDRLNVRLHHACQNLEATLEAVHHGIITINARGEVHVCNSIALRLLNLPAELIDQPFNMAEVIPQLSKLELLPGENTSSVELEIMPSRFIKIRAKHMAGGGIVLVIEDISFERQGQSAQLLAEAEYRSLFENAVCGIYRDKLDGTPVRCNPALAAFNGYASEDEYTEAVTGTRVTWYVDPNQSIEFKKLLAAEGRVRDLVSEVYRHHTREKVWITENAWYVRNADGVPIFIEGTIQDATERITTLAIIERQVNIDTLTGVASRFRFINCLEAETRPGKHGCTLFSIDLDRFKEVNDFLGHAAGDIVLKLVANRLQSLVSEPWLLARLGGDEFAILQPGLCNQSTVETLAKRIVVALREPLRINGHDLTFGASVGIAMFPNHASDAEELLGNADFAMYQAKSSGRNGFRIFDFELRADIQHRKELKKELRVAIEDDQLELYYQPIATAGVGTVEGYEGLMRWNHPKRGFLPPSQFIPIAEEAGLMTDLGNWAITRACQQAAVLPSHIKISVNVSPSQFRSASILVKLRNVLQETKLDPSRLILEITESAIHSNELIAEKILKELQALGVQIALDDFGTGYSSLSYLQRFPFNTVKIDRSFVAGMLDLSANLAVIRAVLGIGRDLGIRVVAEGVETQQQVDALLREGCVLIQGYFYGKPKPYSEIVSDLAIQQLDLPRSNLTANSIRLVS
jgi:diguanylate cyclase (GGDEF)-like protein/PAS domain S-box-containing protein